MDEFKEGVGAVWRDIKEWSHMQNINEKNDNQADVEYVILTESGISSPGGEIIITEGKVVDLARKCEQLLEEGKTDEFELLIHGVESTDLDEDGDPIMIAPEYDLLTHEEKVLLLGTHVSKKYKGRPGTVMGMLMNLESDRYIARRNAKLDFKERGDRELSGKHGILTESGIVVNNGEIITEGKVVDLARKCDELLKEGKSDEFERLIIGVESGELDEDGDPIMIAPEYDLLNQDEQRLLLVTGVSGYRSVIRALSQCESNRYLVKRDVKFNEDDILNVGIND